MVVNDPKKTACNRCQDQLKYRELKHFFESTDEEEARRVRGKIEAKERGELERFNELDESGVFKSADEVNDNIENKFLEQKGLQEIKSGKTENNSRSRKQIVIDGINNSSPPTKSNIIDYAMKHGISKESANDLLVKIKNRGEVTCQNGEYREL